MFNARNPASFYTGSFSTAYIVPNTPYLHKGDLIAATDYYCAQEHFDADKCSSLARQLGERVGVLVPNAATQAMPATPSTNTKTKTTNATVAAATFAVSGNAGVKNEFNIKRK